MTEETLFELLLKTPEAERAALLDLACEGRPELRQRVEALLKADAAPAQFLAKPPALDATGPDDTASYSASDVPGVVIAGRYKLLEAIGEGGMGTVWMAQQSEPVKRLVAIKLIKAGMDSKAVLARFEAERQALAMMDHPNIAKVLDGGLDSPLSPGGRWAGGEGVQPTGRPFFVMELVKGTPITKFCDERKLSLKERLELFVPVCQAIQHAHQKGVIHRDIKPSNVLIALYDDKPLPKVIDFGVAKATGAQLTEQTLNTGFGAIVGTPEYMSPEQASLNNLDIDTRSDVYALGVLLYELLTGTTPVDKKSLGKAAMLEILRIVREVEAPRPSTKLSSSEALPSIAANRHTEPAKLSKMMKGELDWIVMKALEKDRARRYETANGFAQDIQRYLSNEVVEARPASTVYRVKKWMRRNPLPVAVASSLFLAITGGLISTEIQRSRAEQETNAKLAAFEKLEEEQKKTQAALVEARANEEKAANQSRLIMMTYLDGLFFQGRYAQAEKECMIFVKSLPDEEFDRKQLLLLNTEYFIGECKLRMGKTDEAKKIFLQYKTELSKLVKPDHSQIQMCNLQLAYIYVQDQNYTTAENLLQEVIKVFVRETPRQMLLYDAESLLGMCLMAQKKYEDAERMLLSGCNGLIKQKRELLIPNQYRLTGAIDRLIQLYTETNKSEEVKKWQAEKDKLPKDPG